MAVTGGSRTAEVAHAIVLGCGRSGTSIFGELFGQLPEFTYHSEPPFEDLTGYDYAAPVAIKMPRPAATGRAAPGLPFLVEDLFTAVPEPRQVFWLVRHPLDAICSLRVGISQDWGHHPRPPDWESWNSAPLLRRCAHHWVHINTLGYDRMRHLAAVYRFEDMIRDPLRLARRVCAQVGLDPAARAAHLTNWALRVQDQDNDDFDEAACSKPYSRSDHIKKVGRWRENLSSAEAADLIPLVAVAAARFGYQLP